jgi:hypothetical protein
MRRFCFICKIVLIKPVCEALFLSLYTFVTPNVGASFAYVVPDAGRAFG